VSSDKLLGQHTFQLHFEQSVLFFLFWLNHYAPSHLSHPHLLLLNTIYLVSLFYLSSDSHLSHIHKQAKWNPLILEMTFLTALRKAMVSSGLLLQHLFNVFLTTSLLGRYLHYVGRPEEGYHEGLGTVLLLLLHLLNIHINLT
jgi:hypothetical protein